MTDVTNSSDAASRRMPRDRWTLEAKNASPAEIAQEVVARLRRINWAITPNVTIDTPLSEEQRAKVQPVLEQWGKSVAQLQTWGDVALACTGDLDADGATDFDLGLFVATGLSVPTHPMTLRNVLAANERDESGISSMSLRMEHVIGQGEGDMRLTPEGASLDVRLMVVTVDAQDTYAPLPDELPSGAEPIGEVQLKRDFQQQPVLVLGNTYFRAKRSTEIPGLPAGTAAQWIEKLLALPAPDDSPFGSIKKQMVEEKALSEGREPKDPALATVWRGSRLTRTTIDNAMAKAKQRYGVKPLKYAGYIDEKVDTFIARAMLEAANPKLGVSASFLHTVAFGEGLNHSVDGNVMGEKGWATDGKDWNIDGYGALGVDTFGSKLKVLRKGGFLPATSKEGRDFVLAEPAPNEKNILVKSATFMGLKNGLIGLTAMLAYYRHLFIEDVRAHSVDQLNKLTDEQINFFTYMYFNAGPAFGKDFLMKRGFEVKPWIGKEPQTNTVARFNALQRISSWKMLELLNLYPKAQLNRAVG